MAGADRIEVVCFDHAQIQKGLVHAADGARDRIRLMAVYTPEGYGSPVQSQDAVFYLHFPETDLLCDDLSAGIHDQRVKERFFRVPEKRVLHGNAD